MATTFTILHLSDAHLGNPAHKVNVVEVLKPLSKDIKHVASEYNLKPDLLIFSGDLVFGDIPDKPIKTQYDEALVWLKGIYTSLNVSFLEIPLLLVPGNHDINRRKIDESQKKWVKDLGYKDEDNIEQHMKSNDILWSRLISRQEEWVNFVSSLEQKQWDFDPNLLLTTGIIECGDKKIGVAGLNTSWACSTSKEEGQLWIGRYPATKAWQAVEECDLRICVTHHPLGWLNSAEKPWMEEKIASNFHFHLHGHEHTSWFTQSDNHIRLAAGACYAGSKFANSYSWIQYDFESSDLTLYLREYTDRGRGDWKALHIPGKTDVYGIRTIKNFIQDLNLEKKKSDIVHEETSVTSLNLENSLVPEDSAIISLKLQTGNSAVKDSEPIHQRNILTYIIHMEKSYGFRWERKSYRPASEKPYVYWPVRLRRPTPIHAVQCFTAAGLQKTGATINLYLDDLGNHDVSPEIFLSTVSAWFEKVGGNFEELKVQKFSDVIKGDKEKKIWDLLHQWLLKSQNIKDVLSVTKLWSKDIVEATEVEQLRKQIRQLLDHKPRRLLSPALTWTGLVHLSNDIVGSDIITLGGYDERDLWAAWRDSVATPQVHIGHLYVSELYKSKSPSTSETLHMEQTDLAWDSKEDIVKALQNEVNLTKENKVWLADNRMVPWCFKGCVQLPAYLMGEKAEFKIQDQIINSCDEFEKFPAHLIADEVAELTTRWLL